VRVAGVDPRSLPKTIDGVREAWSIIEETWAATFADAQGLEESALHAGVNGEWSFVETQRHLLFVTDAWIVRTILGSATPYHRLGLPPDHRIGEPDPAVDVSAWGIDVFAAASLDEVLDARRDRMGIVRGVLDGLTPGALQQVCDANPAPGFPPSTVIPVGFCIDVVIGEEWAHHDFATRDLATLTD
jgi:hypothetical protein